MIEKIRSDYQTILDMKFWEVYLGKITEWIKNANTDTNSLDPIADATKLAREQGKLTAFKLVLGLPGKIVKGE